LDKNKKEGYFPLAYFFPFLLGKDNELFCFFNKNHIF